MKKNLYKKKLHVIAGKHNFFEGRQKKDAESLKRFEPSHETILQLDNLKVIVK